MGNARGFWTLKEWILKIAPKERILNYKEFTIPLDKKNKKFKVDDVWIVG